MTDYISREALGIGKCNPDIFDDKGYAKGWNAAVDIVMNAPAADVRPVVLCRDCVVPHNKYTGCPKLGGLVTPPEFFCAYGETSKESCTTKKRENPKWIDKGHFSLMCSECRCYISTNLLLSEHSMNFCPNCGADMRPQPPKEE